jgi:FkbM family methyltransferase
MDAEKIKKTLDDNPALTGEFIRALLDVEAAMGYPENNVRDTFTGLLADEVFKGRTFIKNLSNGLRMKFIYNSKIAREFLLSTPAEPDHVWEPQTTKVLAHFSASARHVIVGGAYFGDHAILIADIMRGTGVCHAFEPNETNCSLIEDNAQLNKISNIRINKMALWSKSGEKLRFEGEDALASTVPASVGSSGYIETVTLDDYMIAANIDSLDLLMIDVEGGEMKVLQGAVEMFQKNSPVVIFENHSLHNDWSNSLQNSDSVKWMRVHGYHVFSIRDFHNNMNTAGMKVELVPVERTFTEGPPHGFNLLAVKNKSLIEHDLFRIVYDYSPKLLLHKKEKEFLPAVIE